MKDVEALSEHLDVLLESVIDDAKKKFPNMNTEHFAAGVAGFMIKTGFAIMAKRFPDEKKFRRVLEPIIVETMRARG